MWKLFVSLVLLAQLVGCSLLNKPKAVDGAQAQAPLPEAVVTGYNQGLELLKEQKWDEAKTHWQAFAEHYPLYPGVWVNLALIELHFEQLDASQAYLDKALAIASDFCPAAKVEALVKRQQGQFKEAEVWYKKALDCDATDARTAYNLAILYDLYLQDLPNALAYYQKAKELTPDADANLDMWIADLQKRQPTRLAGEGE